MACTYRVIKQNLTKVLIRKLWERLRETKKKMMLHLWTNEDWVITPRSEGPGEGIANGTPKEL